MIGCSSSETTEHTSTIENNKQTEKKKKAYLDNQQVEALSDHLKILSSNSMAGRKFASSESVKAQNYIIYSLTKSNTQPFQKKFRHSFKHKTFFSKEEIGSNIIGYVKGTKFPDQYIVLSAHYDHLGKKGSTVFNGADDNASGTAAILAFGQAIAKTPLKHSVIFLFTDGEEVNLLGAKAFITQQKRLLPQIRLNINIDMIAGSLHTNKLHFIDNRLDKVLSQNKIDHLKALPKDSTIRIKRGFKRESYKANNMTRWLNASDHASFNRKHIPFIYFGVGEHKNYHTTHDDFNNVNLPFFIQACQSIFRYLTFFDENIESL